MRLRQLAAAGLLAALIGCASIPTQPPTQRWNLTVQVQADGEPVEGVAIDIEGGLNHGPKGQTDASGRVLLPNLTQGGFTLCTDGDVVAFRHCIGVNLVNSQTVMVPVQLAAPVLQPRRGVVRANGRGFQDDDGPFLGIGATFFAAAWAYKFDRARLEANLDLLAGGGVDYIRVLGHVGPEGWQDRTVDPAWPDFDQVIAGLTDLVYDHGMRTEWTIYGGVDLARTPGERRALVDRFVAMAQGREHKIMHWEVANEAWQNGFGGPEGRDELRQLAQVFRDGTPNLVALSAAPDELRPDGRHYATWLYENSAANVFTIHLDRDISGEGGLWRPVRQPWEVQFLDGIPMPWTSNEPIGPQSSVNADADAWRIGVSPLVVWVSGGAGYVYHAGPGVRFGGLEDLARGRASNFVEVENISQHLAAFRALKAVLPADLPTWRQQNSNPNYPEFPFDNRPIQDRIETGDILRAFCAIKPEVGQFVCTALKVQADTPFIARQAMTVDVVDPMTGLPLRSVDLEVGQTLTLTPERPAYLLMGRWR